MSKQIVLRSPTSVNRRQPLLQSQSSYSSSPSRSSIITRKSAKFGEVCGSTTAECAAVCCCCPCAIANLLVLAVYKVPAGLCRRALRQRRQQKLLKGGELLQRNRQLGFEDNQLQIHPVICLEDFFMDVQVSEESEKAVVELEKEMRKRFYGTGFWRSPSQREESPRVKQK